jgi:two-component system, response regulator YesN
MSTVLIVDDDHSIRKAIHALFDCSGGFDVCIEACNGIEAIAETQQLSPNLAVVDLSMPEMAGLGLAQKLKAISPALSIFVLTADYDMSIEREALSCGATAVFSKLDDLSTIVANARAVCGMD